MSWDEVESGGLMMQGTFIQIILLCGVPGLLPRLSLGIQVAALAKVSAPNTSLQGCGERGKGRAAISTRPQRKANSLRPLCVLLRCQRTKKLSYSRV
jgi:hypothetical protein